MLEVSILYVKPEPSKKELDALLPLVSAERRARAQKFFHWQDACNCILGDVLARIGVCRATGFNNKQIAFDVNEFGKPYLTQNLNIHFNISHSKSYVACAISDKSVGLDIEFVKQMDLKIAERFFTSDEISYIMAEPEDMHRFYEVWTKKESRIKLDGRGLSMPLSSFSVFESQEIEKLNYLEVLRSDDVICHVCTSKESISAIEIIDIPTLIWQALGLD